MNRAELNKAIIYATEIVRQDEVYIIGSQSILGSFDEEELPADVTLSNEVDIAPVADDPDETAATLLDGQIGELSEFHAENGFYIQGVGKRTANLPQGWKARLVPVRPPGHPKSVGLCLEPHDLCAAKLLANREKDRAFVTSLLEAGLVNAKTIRARIDALDPNGVSGDRIQVARKWAKWAIEEYPEPKHADNQAATKLRSSADRRQASSSGQRRELNGEYGQKTHSKPEIELLG